MYLPDPDRDWGEPPPDQPTSHPVGAVIIGFALLAWLAVACLYIVGFFAWVAWQAM